MNKHYKQEEVKTHYKDGDQKYDTATDYESRTEHCESVEGGLDTKYSHRSQFGSYYNTKSAQSTYDGFAVGSDTQSDVTYHRKKNKKKSESGTFKLGSASNSYGGEDFSYIF